MEEHSTSRVSNGAFASAPDHVVFARVSGKMVLLNLESGEYYGLNGVGSRIWTLMQERNSLPEVLDAMLQEYKVDRETLYADLIKFVDNLTSLGLVATGHDRDS